MKLKNALVLLTLFCVAVFFSGCDSNDPDKTIEINDQLAHYTFENNADDLVGSNDGNVANVSFLSANDGMAAQFNANSYIYFPTNFDYRERTVSLWFKAILVTDVLGVIYVCDNPFIENGMTVLSVGDANGVARLSFNACGQTASVEIEEGQWYHAVVTVDANEYVFYLDGEEIDNENIADNTTHSGNGEDGTLLGTSRVFDRYFVGQVDNMRVYNRVLSEEEVGALYEDEN